MRGRQQRRIRRAHFAKKMRRFGQEVLIIWGLVAVSWSYTGWALFAAIVYQVHVHIPIIVLLADLLFLVLAVWTTRQWFSQKVRLKKASKPVPSDAEH